MQIPWELFPAQPEEIGAALDRAVRYMEEAGRPYALVMPKGVVAAFPLGQALQQGPARAGTLTLDASCAAPAARPSRGQALREVLAHTRAPGTVVLASTGFCGRELYALEDRPGQFYMVGSMGCVTSLALGLALSRPDLRVIALDGDGAALMRMGNFATIGAYAPPNLRHLLLDNGAHDSTGGQATVSPRISFAAIAAACGYASALQTAQLTQIGPWLQAPSAEVRAICLACRRLPGAPADLPRPTLSPVAVRERLVRHLAEAGP